MNCRRCTYLGAYEIADNTLIILTSDNGPVIDDGYLDLAEELLGNHRPLGNYQLFLYVIYV